MASQSPDSDGIPNGQIKPSTNWGEFNSIAFTIQQALSKMQTATLVRVKSCTNSGGLTPVGYADVTPMVNQLDCQGNPTPHGTIYGLPYLRVQGGRNAVIIDPEPGDIGVAVFSSRDISQVKRSKKQGNPGSFRQYSFSDGMYIGGMLNAEPNQYLQFNAGGIKLHSPNAIVIDAPIVEINAGTSVTITTPVFKVNGATTLNGTVSQTGGGSAHFSGTITVDNDVIAEGTSLHTHTHGGVQTGGSQTGAPT